MKEKYSALPKAILVPFSYPDYPENVVARWLSKSQEMLEELSCDFTITPVVKGREDALRVAALIRQSKFDFILALLLSWIEAPNFIATLQEFFNFPLLLWTHTTWWEEGEQLTLGAVPAAGVIRETLEEMGVRFEFVWGMPDRDSDSLKEKISRFVRVACAIERLKRARVGLFGYFSMGMYTGGFDHIKVRRILGPEVVHLGQEYVVKEFQRVDSKKARDLMKEVLRKWTIAKDVDKNSLLKAIRIYLGLKKLIQKHDLNALTLKCQYELSREWGFAPCLPLSMLADEVTASCEGDVPLVISQLILNLLSGKVTGYGDVHDIMPDNSILLAACGFAPLSFAEVRPQIKKHTALYEGLLVSFPYREGKVTLCRLAPGNTGYKMHIATGKTQTPPHFHEVGCAPYALAKVKLDGSVEDFFQNLMSQHYAICYGDFKMELLSLCKFLHIKPVICI